MARGTAARLFDRRDRHARVHGDDAGLVGEHRIEINLADLGEIGDKLRQLDQKKLDGALVGGGHVAVSLEDAGDPGAGDEAAREREVERRQRQRLVTDDLNRRASLPEDNDRAESRIIGDADDELTRFRTHDHGEDGDPGNSRAGFFRPRPIENIRGRLVHRALAGEVEANAADLRLVHDVGGLNLEDNRRAGGEVRLCRRDGFRGAGRQGRRRDRNAVGGKNTGHLDRVEPGSLVAQYAVNDGTHGSDVRHKVLRHAGRRRHQQLARFPVAHEMHEARDRA